MGKLQCLAPLRIGIVMLSYVITYLPYAGFRILSQFIDPESKNLPTQTLDCHVTPDVAGLAIAKLIEMELSTIHLDIQSCIGHCQVEFITCQRMLWNSLYACGFKGFMEFFLGRRIERFFSSQFHSTCVVGQSSYVWNLTA